MNTLLDMYINQKFLKKKMVVLTQYEENINETRSRSIKSSIDLCKLFIVINIKIYVRLKP